MARPPRKNVSLPRECDLPQFDDRLAAMCNRPKNLLQEIVATRAIWRLATIIKRDPRLNRDPPPERWTAPEFAVSELDPDVYAAALTEFS